MVINNNTINYMGYNQWKKMKMKELDTKVIKNKKLERFYTILVDIFLIVTLGLGLVIIFAVPALIS